MKLVEKLICLRKEKGLTQLELAEAMEVSRQAVSKWETGGALPSTENLLGLCKLYGVPTDYLLNDGEEEIGKFDSLPQEEGGNLGISCKDTRKTAIKWGAIALIFFILIVSIGVVIANRNKVNLHLGEVRGEVVTEVPKVEFSLEW